MPVRLSKEEGYCQKLFIFRSEESPEEAKERDVLAFLLPAVQGKTSERQTPRVCVRMRRYVCRIVYGDVCMKMSVYTAYRRSRVILYVSEEREK